MLDLLGGGAGIVSDRDRPPTRLAGHPLQLRDALEDVTAVRHPPVGVTDDALEDLGPAAAEDDRRVWLLHRLWVRPHGAEVDQVAVVLGSVVGPDGLHRFDLLPEQLPAGPEVGAVVGHLLAIPSGSDPEDESSVGGEVQAGDLFGRVDGVALDDQADACGDTQRLAGHGGDGERDEGIHGVPVVLRQLSPGRPRRLPAGRDVGVLRDPQRLKAELFGGGSELAHRDRVVGGKDGHPELHAPIVGAMASRPGPASPPPRPCLSRRRGRGTRP